MYKLCKTEQSAARQRELEKGLLTMMGRFHYDEITVSELCAGLQIPRKSFYRYFSGKEGALHALLDHTLMEFQLYSDMDGNRSQRSVKRDLEQFFLFWKGHRELLDALKQSGLSGVLIERALRHAESETVMHSRLLSIESRQLQQQTVLFCVCGMMSMALNWHHTGFVQPPEQMAEMAAWIMGNPMFPVGADGG